MESETQQLSSSTTITSTTVTTTTTASTNDNNNRDDEQQQQQPTKIVLFVEGPLCMRRHDTTLSLLQDVMVYLNGFLARYDSGSFDFLYRHFTWLKRDSIMNLRYFILTNVQVLLTTSDSSTSAPTHSSTVPTTTASSSSLAVSTKKKWMPPQFFKIQRKESKQLLHTLEGLEEITPTATASIHLLRTSGVRAKSASLTTTGMGAAAATTILDVPRNSSRRTSKDFFRQLMHLPTKTSTAANELTTNSHKLQQQSQEQAARKQISLNTLSRPLLLPVPKTENDNGYVLMAPVSLHLPQTSVAETTTVSSSPPPSPLHQQYQQPVSLTAQPSASAQHQPQQHHWFNLTEKTRSVSLESGTSVYVSANSSPTLQHNTRNYHTLSTSSSSSAHTTTSSSNSSTSPPSSLAVLTPTSSLDAPDTPLSQVSSNQLIFEEFHHPSLDEIEHFVKLQSYIGDTIVDFNSTCVVDGVPITRFTPPTMLAPNYYCAYHHVQNQQQQQPLAVTSTPPPLSSSSSSSIVPLPHMILNMAIIEDDELSYSFAFNETSARSRSPHNDRYNSGAGDRSNLLDDDDGRDIACLDSGQNFINNLSKFFRKRKSSVTVKTSNQTSNGYVNASAEDYYDPDSGKNGASSGSDNDNKLAIKRAQRSHSSPAVFSNIMFMSTARNKLSRAFIKWKLHTQQISPNNARHILLRSKSFVESTQTTTGYMNVTNRICQILKPPPISSISSLPADTITGRLQVGREIQNHNQCLDIAWHGRYFVLEQNILHDLCMDFVFSLNGYIIEPKAYSFRFQSRILNNRKIWDYIYSLWDSVAQTSIRLGYRPLFVWTLPMCEHVEFLNDHAHHLSFSHFNIRHFIANQIYTYRTIYAVFNVGYHLRANRPDISSDDVVRTVRQLLLLESCE